MKESCALPAAPALASKILERPIQDFNQAENGKPTEESKGAPGVGHQVYLGHGGSAHDLVGQFFLKRECFLRLRIGRTRKSSLR